MMGWCVAACYQETGPENCAHIHYISDCSSACIHLLLLANHLGKMVGSLDAQVWGVTFQNAVLHPIQTSC